jgi:hypothetical protein
VSDPTQNLSYYSVLTNVMYYILWVWGLTLCLRVSLFIFKKLLKFHLICSNCFVFHIRHIWLKRQKEGKQMEDIMKRLLVVAGIAVCIRLLFLVGLAN